VASSAGFVAANEIYYKGTNNAGTQINMMRVNSNNDAHFFGDISASDVGTAYMMFNSPIPFVFGGSCCGGSAPTSISFNSSGDLSLKVDDTTKLIIKDTTYNVGVLDLTPLYALTVGLTDAFGVDSSGNATSSGYIQVGKTFGGSGVTLGVGDAWIGAEATTTGNLTVKAMTANTTASAANVFVDSNGLLYQSTSALRFKTNIDYNGVDGDLLYKLKPVSFESKSDGSKHIGFIAEDVAEVEPRLATYDSNGEPVGVEYGNVTALLTQTVKDQQKEIERLKKQTGSSNYWGYLGLLGLLPLFIRRKV
jgi:hypothetical protein